MAVAETVDLERAIRTYLRESTVLASADYLGSNREIYIGYPKDKMDRKNVPPFLDMIVIMGGRGGPGRNELDQIVRRVDFLCFGQTEIKANKLYRALDYYLNPIGVRRKTSFTRNNCQVNTIRPENASIQLYEPDLANWPYCLATYMFNYNSQYKE